MENAIHESEIQGFARRNYLPDQDIALMSDALYYDSAHKYFHTVDGRFAQVWRIEMIDQSVLSLEDRVQLANKFSTFFAVFPYGSSGQLLRVTHRGIEGVLSDFVGDGSPHPFGNDILQSIVQRQEHAAMDRGGFFSKVSPRMQQQAMSELSEAIAQDSTDAKDKYFNKEKAFELLERSTRTGAFPYVSELYLTFLWTPPSSVISKVSRFVKYCLAGMNLCDIEKEAYNTYKEQQRQFLQHATKIQKEIQSSEFVCYRTLGQGFLDMLYRLLNPIRSHRISSPSYEDTDSIKSHHNYCPKFDGEYTIGHNIARTFLKSDVPDRGALSKKATFQPIVPDEYGLKWPYKQDGETKYYYGRITTVGDLPATLQPGILQDVLQFNEGESLVTLNFTVTKKLQVESRLYTRKKMLEVAGQFKSANDQNHQRRIEDLNSVKAAVAADNVYNPQRMLDLGVYCSFFGFDEDRVDERAELAESELFGEGIRESVRGDAMMHHSFPLNYRPSARGLLRRETPTLSSHAGRLAPIFVEYQGCHSPAILVNNRSGEPIFIDIFDTSRSVAAHSLVCGSTGTGKSFAFNTLLMTMMAKYRPKVWLIDKGGSYESLCSVLDGQYIYLVTEETDGIKPTCINPMYVPPDSDGNPRLPETSELEFLTKWIISAIKASGDDEKLKASALTVIYHSLDQFYQDWPIEQEATLSDYMKVLETVETTEISGKAVSEQLGNYYGRGAYASLFDGKLDIEWDADLIVLETEKMADSFALPVAMLALFRQIEIYTKYRLPRNRRKIVGVDEAWNTIANKEAANALGGFFRELRKYKGGVLLISQTLADFVKLVSHEGGAEDGILSNTCHFFLLACSVSDHAIAMKELDFTQEEVNAWKTVSSLPPFFSEVFYRQKLKSNQFYSGIFRLYSSPVPLWIATTDPDDVEIRRELITKKIGDGVAPREARRSAISELAGAYPFGSRYQIDEPGSVTG